MATGGRPRDFMEPGEWLTLRARLRADEQEARRRRQRAADARHADVSLTHYDGSHGPMFTAGQMIEMFRRAGFGVR